MKPEEIDEIRDTLIAHFGLKIQTDTQRLVLDKYFASLNGMDAFEALS